jgi:hypothetical protein
MTAYTSSNVASGQATYRSAPQGAAVTASSTAAKSLSMSVSAKAIVRTPRKASSRRVKRK